MDSISCCTAVAFISINRLCMAPEAAIPDSAKIECGAELAEHVHGNEFVYYAWDRDADADDDGVVVVVFGCRPVIPRYAYLKRATQRRRLDKIDVRPTDEERGTLGPG